MSKNRMNDIKDYNQFAIDNEEVFKNILIDLGSNEEVPYGFVAQGVKTELPLDEIFKKYSEGRKLDTFTITDFEIPEEGKATISFQYIGTLGAIYAQMEYSVKDGNSVTFQKPVSLITE